MHATLSGLSWRQQLIFEDGELLAHLVVPAIFGDVERFVRQLTDQDEIARRTRRHRQVVDYEPADRQMARIWSFNCFVVTPFVERAHDDEPTHLILAARPAFIEQYPLLAVGVVTDDAVTRRLNWFAAAGRQHRHKRPK